MSEHEQHDDTTEGGAGSRPFEKERERAPQNYYYDDGTGYESYKPEDTDEDVGEENVVVDN